MNSVTISGHVNGLTFVPHQSGKNRYWFSIERWNIKDGNRYGISLRCSWQPKQGDPLVGELVDGDRVAVQGKLTGDKHGLPILSVSSVMLDGMAPEEYKGVEVEHDNI